LIDPLKGAAVFAYQSPLRECGISPIEAAAKNAASQNDFWHPISALNIHIKKEST
jgi:hypothetical protein